MRAAAHLSLSVVLALGAVTLAGCPADPDEPVAPPGAPTGVTATPADSAVTLAWTASPGATSYNVYRADAAAQPLANMTKVGSGIGATAFNAAGANDTQWYFRVTAVNSGGESPPSDEVSATPLLALAPAAPTGVKATAANQTVTITWDPVPAATSYRVYWDDVPGATTADNSIACASSPCTHMSLTNGTAYYYAVTAFIGGEESALSTEVTATPRALPYINATAIMTPALLGNGQYTVEVCTSSNCLTQITNATVKLGGMTLTYDAAEDAYVGEPSSSIAGAYLRLEVTIPPGAAAVSGTYSAAGTMYTQGPTLASPATGAIWLASSNNVFTWSHGSPTAGSIYTVAAVNFSNILASYVALVPTTSSTHTVPANSLSPGAHYGILTIGPDGGPIAIPDTASGSGLTLTATSNFASFTVQ